MEAKNSPILVNNIKNVKMETTQNDAVLTLVQAAGSHENLFYCLSKKTGKNTYDLTLEKISWEDVKEKIKEINGDIKKYLRKKTMIGTGYLLIRYIPRV